MSEKAKTQENSTFKEYIYPVVILTVIALVTTLLLAITNNVTTGVIGGQGTGRGKCNKTGASSGCGQLHAGNPFRIVHFQRRQGECHRILDCRQRLRRGCHRGDILLRRRSHHDGWHQLGWLDLRRLRHEFLRYPPASAPRMRIRITWHSTRD